MLKNNKFLVNAYYFIYLTLNIIFLIYIRYNNIDNTYYYLLIMLGVLLYLLHLKVNKQLNILDIKFTTFLKYLLVFLFSFFLWSMMAFLFMMFYYSYEELVSSVTFDSNTFTFMRRILLFLSFITYTTIIENSEYIKKINKTLPSDFNISEAVYIFFSLIFTIYVNLNVYFYLFVILILMFSMPDFLILIIYKTLMGWKEELKNNPKAVVIIAILVGILIALFIGENKAFAADKETKTSGLGDSSSKTPKKPNIHPSDKKLLSICAKKAPIIGKSLMYGVWGIQGVEYVADKVKNLPHGRPATPPSPGTFSNPFSGTK